MRDIPDTLQSVQAQDIPDNLVATADGTDSQGKSPARSDTMGMQKIPADPVPNVPLEDKIPEDSLVLRVDTGQDAAAASLVDMRPHQGTPAAEDILVEGNQVDQQEDRQALRQLRSPDIRSVQEGNTTFKSFLRV